jgi:hypothetical protein
MLTVTHLNGPGGPCRCDPLCADPAHLRAMCNRCHLRYDVRLHAAHAYQRRRAGRALGDLFPMPAPQPLAARDRVAQLVEQVPLRYGPLRLVERVPTRSEYL